MKMWRWLLTHLDDHVFVELHLRYGFEITEKRLREESWHWLRDRILYLAHDPESMTRRALPEHV